MVLVAQTIFLEGGECVCGGGHSTQKMHVPVFQKTYQNLLRCMQAMYEGWNFNSGNYLFTTDTQ